MLYRIAQHFIPGLPEESFNFIWGFFAPLILAVLILLVLLAAKFALPAVLAHLGWAPAASARNPLQRTALRAIVIGPVLLIINLAFPSLLALLGLDAPEMSFVKPLLLGIVNALLLIFVLRPFFELAERIEEKEWEGVFGETRPTVLAWRRSRPYTLFILLLIEITVLFPRFTLKALDWLLTFPPIILALLFVLVTFGPHAAAKWKLGPKMSPNKLTPEERQERTARILGRIISSFSN